MDWAVACVDIYAAVFTTVLKLLEPHQQGTISAWL